MNNELTTYLSKLLMGVTVLVLVVLGAMQITSNWQAQHDADAAQAWKAVTR